MYLVLMVREAGARKVFFASCAPPITNAHIYGKDPSIIAFIDGIFPLRTLGYTCQPAKRLSRNQVHSSYARTNLSYEIGIDLASTSEMIAHHRSADAIASHLKADKVIFQTLDDLKAACTEAVMPGAEPRTDFEVGVFCGKYVTPVDDAYFLHLEQVRGESRKLKVMESAREAVANGSANHQEMQMATNGVHVNEDGSVVPAEPRSNWGAVVDASGKRSLANGDAHTHYQHSRDEEFAPSPTMSQDVSLHNLNDV